MELSLQQDYLLNNFEIAEFLDCVNDDYLKDLLKDFIKSLFNYKEYEIYCKRIGCDLLFYGVDKNICEGLREIQKISMVQKENSFMRMCPNTGKINEFMLKINLVNSEYAILSVANIKEYYISKKVILCNTDKNNQREIHIKNKGDVFVYQNKRKYYPITLKTISWFSNSNFFFYELFCSFFKIMGLSYPLYKDLYRDFKQNVNYVYCSLKVNEAKEYGSYQQWLLGHYKTVSNVPKSINKERLNIAVFKVLACRYVEENHQQKIYKMKTNDDYCALSQNDIFFAYYLNKFKNCNYRIIRDYVSMMIYLRRKINICTNSYSKLKQAHNDIINPYMHKKAKTVGKSKMTIPKKSPFRKLKLPDDFEIIKNGKRLYVEGNTMHHCVYSYRKQVNKGRCVIAHLTYKENPYTLEIVCRAQTYRCVQMYGKWDSVAPKDVWDYVKDVLKKQSEILKK